MKLEWKGTSIPARGVVALPRGRSSALRGDLGIDGRIRATACWTPSMSDDLSSPILNAGGCWNSESRSLVRQRRARTWVGILVLELHDAAWEDTDITSADVLLTLNIVIHNFNQPTSLLRYGFHNGFYLVSIHGYINLSALHLVVIESKCIPGKSLDGFSAHMANADRPAESRWTAICIESPR